jgi:capsid protein
MTSPSLLDQFGKPLAYSTPDGGPASSGYDAANNSRTRSSMGTFPINSRKEITEFSRREIVRKCRAIDANLGFVGRIKSKASQHAVGKGVFARPCTLDEEFNQAVVNYTDGIFENPDVYSIDGTRDFYEDQRLAAEAMIDDGEYFTAFVRDDRDGELRMQHIDPFEVKQPLGVTKDWNDGVHTDAFNRVVEYSIAELPAPWEGAIMPFRHVAANQLIHVFKRRRAKQWRGLPWIYAGANSLIDALDLKSLEVGTAKLHSAIGIVAKKGNKDPKSNGGVGSQLQKMLDPDGSGDRPREVSETFFQGAAIHYCGLDEGLELVTSTRPSSNLLAFIEFLYREAAIGTGLPVEVLYEMSKLGGVTARAIMDDAQTWFGMLMDRIITQHSRPIYLAFVLEGMRTGAIPVCRDPRWWSVEWQGPAKMNADYGRTAQANIQLLKNGMLGFEDYFEQHGLTARSQHLRQIKHLAWLKQQCAESGVPIEWLIEPPAQIQNINHVASNSQDAD